MKSIDQSFGRTSRGPDLALDPLSGDNYKGFGTINSGSVSTSISTALVRSSSIIRIDERLSGSLGIAVSSGGHLVISAITDGTSFEVSNAKGVAVDWDRTFSWQLIQTTES